MQPNEQIPSQLPPDPNLSPTQPVRRTVIQPLSSEEDIRQAAASSGATPARPSEPGVNPASDYSSEAAGYESPTYQNSYESGLITEPIHRANHAPLPYSVPKIPVSDIAPRPKKSVTRIFIIVGIIFAVGVLGLAAWLFLFNRVSPVELAQENINVLDRVSSTELAQEDVGQSTYLRPKDWSQVSGTNSYENIQTEGEGPTALVTVNEFSPDSALDALYKNRDDLQKWYMDKLPDNILMLAVYTSAPMECDKDTLTVTRRADATKNSTTIGVISADVSCRKEGGTVTMKMRIVTGMNDERERMIVVGATALEWSKNGKVFQQMLDSVEERKTT